MKSLALPSEMNQRENKHLKQIFTSNLAERIRQIRESKKITQADLANKASLHLTYVGHLEAGKYHPSVYTLWKIAKALKVNIGEIVNF